MPCPAGIAGVSPASFNIRFNTSPKGGRLSPRGVSPWTPFPNHRKPPQEGDRKPARTLEGRKRSARIIHIPRAHVFLLSPRLKPWATSLSPFRAYKEMDIEDAGETPAIPGGALHTSHARLFIVSPRLKPWATSLSPFRAYKEMDIEDAGETGRPAVACAIPAGAVHTSHFTLRMRASSSCSRFGLACGVRCCRVCPCLSVFVRGQQTCGLCG